MNPLIIIVALVVALFSWILAVSLRRGEFRFKTRSPTGVGNMTATSYAHVKRSDQPVLFWILAALQSGLIFYIASFVFDLI